MKVSSKKAKGRGLQKNIKNILLECFKGQLEEDDIRSTSMGASGVDLLLSPAAQKLIPFAIECKNQERLNIWSAIEQAEKNATQTLKPLVVFKKNYSKTYVALELNEFLALLKK